MHVDGYLSVPADEEIQDWAGEPLAEAPAGTAAVTSGLQALMGQFLGIRRDAAGISQAQQSIGALSRRYEGTAAETPELLDLRARFTVSSLIAGAALRRQESRGAHYRTDFPEKKELWRQHFTDCQANEIDQTGEMTDDVRVGQTAAGMA